MKLKKLGDLVRIVGGGTPSKSNPAFWNGPIPWATVKDLQGTTLDSTIDSITKIGLEGSASNLIPAGTVITATRMALGRAAISTIPMAINQDLKALICSPDLDERFLLHFILANAARIDAEGKGATVKGIKLDFLRAMEVPDLPLHEQKRIANILDKADALRRKRAEALRLADEFLKSTFLDMFGDPVTNPMGWDEVSVEDICESNDDVRCGPFGTQLQKHEFTHTGVPLWGIKHVNKGFAFPTDEFVTKEKSQQLSVYSLIPGDLVMTRKGTIGNCHIYPNTFEPGMMHSDLLRLRVSPKKANAQFICSQFSYSRKVKHQLEIMSPGAVMPGINVSKLKKLMIESPPLDLQNHFASIVKSVERQKTRSNVLLKHSEDLISSLQQRAFSGKI